MLTVSESESDAADAGDEADDELNTAEEAADESDRYAVVAS